MQFSPGLGPGGTTVASAGVVGMSSEARFDSQWGSSLIPHVTFQVGGPEADIHLVALIHGSGVKSRNATVLPRPLHLHEHPACCCIPMCRGSLTL